MGDGAISAIAMVAAAVVTGAFMIWGKKSDATATVLATMKSDLAGLKAELATCREELSKLQEESARWATREGLWDLHTTRLEMQLSDNGFTPVTRPVQLTRSGGVT